MLVPYFARSSTHRQISHLIWLPTHSPSGSTISHKHLTIRPSNNCSPTSILRTRCFLAPTSRWSSNSDHLEFTEIRRSESAPRFDPLRGRGRWTASAPKRHYPGAVDAYHINLRVPSDASKGDERLSFARRRSAIRKPSRKRSTTGSVRASAQA